MTHAPVVPLREVCSINPRVSRKDLPAPETPVSFVPMGAVDETTGRIVERETRPLAEVQTGYTSFAEGDVLFAKITPCMENGKAAMATQLTNGIGRGSTEFYVLRPGDRILGEYIFHFVRQQRFRDQAKRHFTGTAGQQRVPKSFMEEALIPLPPIEEQRRIVDILNRAASIERLKARASAHLRDFIPALFLKMFGDPIENPMGWPTVKLGQIVSEFRYGTSKKSHEDAAEGSTPILRIPNVIDGVVNLVDLKHTVLDAKEGPRLRLESGDLLFVRTNGNPEYIGRCAVFDLDVEAAYASYLIRARVVEGAPISPFLIGDMMALPSVRSLLLTLARTTAGNYNINIESLASIGLPAPPLDAQMRYLSLVTSAKARMRLMSFADALAADLSRSLLDKLLGTDGTAQMHPENDAEDALTV